MKNPTEICWVLIYNEMLKHIQHDNFLPNVA